MLFERVRREGGIEADSNTGYLVDVFGVMFFRYRGGGGNVIGRKCEAGRGGRAFEGMVTACLVVDVDGALGTRMGARVFEGKTSTGFLLMLMVHLELEEKEKHSKE